MAWVARGKCKALGTKKSSTPAVVPGAAPALAKAGVGGLLFLHVSEAGKIDGEKEGVPPAHRPIGV